MVHQFKVLKEKRAFLKSHESYVWMDFAENWNTQIPTEIQSVHFGASKQQFTLHTAMGYIKGKKQSYCTLSENRTHGPPEIMAHIKPVITHLNSQVEAIPEKTMYDLVM